MWKFSRAYIGCDETPGWAGEVSFLGYWLTNCRQAWTEIIQLLNFTASPNARAPPGHKKPETPRQYWSFNPGNR